MADMLKTDGMTSIRDRKLIIYNMKNKEKVKSMPFFVASSQNFCGSSPKSDDRIEQRE